MYFPSPPEALFGDQLERGRAGDVANKDFPLLSASLRIAAYMSLPLQHVDSKEGGPEPQCEGKPLHKELARPTVQQDGKAPKDAQPHPEGTPTTKTDGLLSKDRTRPTTQPYCRDEHSADTETLGQPHRRQGNDRETVAASGKPNTARRKKVPRQVHKC